MKIDCYVWFELIDLSLSWLSSFILSMLHHVLYSIIYFSDFDRNALEWLIKYKPKINVGNINFGLPDNSSNSYSIHFTQSNSCSFVLTTGNTKEHEIDHHLLICHRALDQAALMYVISAIICILKMMQIQTFVEKIRREANKLKWCGTFNKSFPHDVSNKNNRK